MYTMKTIKKKFGTGSIHMITDQEILYSIHDQLCRILHKDDLFQLNNFNNTYLQKDFFISNHFNGTQCILFFTCFEKQKCTFIIFENGDIGLIKICGRKSEWHDTKTIVHCIYNSKTNVLFLMDLLSFNNNNIKYTFAERLLMLHLLIIGLLRINTTTIVSINANEWCRCNQVPTHKTFIMNGNSSSLAISSKNDENEWIDHMNGLIF